MFIIDNTLGFLRFVTLLEGLFIMKSQRAIISKHLNNFSLDKSEVSFRTNIIHTLVIPPSNYTRPETSLDTIHMEDYGLGIRPLI